MPIFNRHWCHYHSINFSFCVCSLADRIGSMLDRIIFQFRSSIQKPNKIIIAVRFFYYRTRGDNQLTSTLIRLLIVYQSLRKKC